MTILGYTGDSERVLRPRYIEPPNFTSTTHSHHDKHGYLLINMETNETQGLDLT